MSITSQTKVRCSFSEPSVLEERLSVYKSHAHHQRYSPAANPKHCFVDGHSVYWLADQRKILLVVYHTKSLKGNTLIQQTNRLLWWKVIG